MFKIEDLKPRFSDIREKNESAQLHTKNVTAF